MAEFKGFDRNIFTLLEINKFNDSKNFYESVKEEIKQGAIVPMRQLCADLSDELYRVDDKMNLVPTKMVSRIRRDTRFSKNKDLYRANVWCMFMRDKHLWQRQPCMWFEFYPDGYDYGVGTFRTDTVFLEAFREHLATHQDEFRRALASLSITNAIPDIEYFKKDKPGIERIADDLKKFYNCKNFYYVYSSREMERLIDGSVKEELIYAIRAFEPMYQFLADITDKIIAEGADKQ